jgi:hypothetical protein
MMMEAFWPRDSDDVVPVIPSFGNNDVYPHNQIGDAHSDGDMLSFYEQLWRPWIPVNQRHTFRQGGYFVVPVGPRLSVLTLNSLYFYKKNKAVHNCHKDNSPGAIQLAWFENQLKKARSEKERIYVIGHVPPSPRDYKGTCLAEYMRVASSYNDVIMGQFFAHLNMDHFMLFDGRQSMQTLQDSAEDDLDIQEDDVHATRNIEAYMGWLRNMYEEIDPLDDKRAPPNTKPPIVAVQVAPSVLPVYFPGLRIYKYEINESEEETDDEEERKPHGTLLGYEQYFSNLTKWNELDSDHIEYELEYSTEEEYEMEDLSVESYFELAKRMVEGDQGGNELWSMFQRHMLVSTQNFTSNPFAQ